MFSGAFAVTSVVLIGQIHISYSYFLLCGKGEPAAVLFIFLLLSAFATCIHLHLHSSINSSPQLACVHLSLSVSSVLCLWWSLCLAWGLWRYWRGNIRVYEACDGMHHHCIYSTVCVGILLQHTKTYTVRVHLHDGYQRRKVFSSCD